MVVCVYIEEQDERERAERTSIALLESATGLRELAATLRKREIISLPSAVQNN